MEFRIENLEAFKIAGYVKSSTNAAMQGMTDCPAFWKEIMETGKTGQIAELITKPPYGLIGASVYQVDEQDPMRFDYYIAAATDLPTPEGFAEYTVPAMTWAVFPCTAETSAQTQMAIVMEWAPSADYELLNSGYETGRMISAAPDLEVYGKGNEVEIWVPVRAQG